MEINTSVHKIYLSCKDDLDIKLSYSTLEKELDIIKINITSKQLKQFSKIELTWNHPIVDIHSCWYPTAGRRKKFDADWAYGFTSNGTSSAPVNCFYNWSGQNRLTCAFSDALNTVRFNMGVHEEDATLKCRIILFTEPTKPMTSYTAELRIDTRDIPYYKTLYDVSKWWETYKEYTPSIVPEIARLPMYSTWYSFHQQLTDKDIEEQCKIAKKLGCEAIIVDDGWQTSDNQRGYAFCGDWETAPEKISDMKKHVKTVHDLGLKYILWFSVPFVGVNSKIFPRFKDKMLTFIDNLETGVLDPRYSDVREYLIQTYEKALFEWDLDGFKLDFVDSFRLPKNKINEIDNNRDYESVQEAVDSLLTNVMNRLKKIKPDIMIEFRQTYIGPYMRKYGNMFRVGDCPNDAINNRIGIADIRLLCGNTAPHSDMVMWSEKDTIESATLQMANIIFGVPQFSMNFNSLPKKHFDMATFWLKFWRENRNVLLDGDFSPLYPELMYPIISSCTETKQIIAVYSDFCIKLENNIPAELILINGTLKEQIILNIEKDLGKRMLKVVNCCGEIVYEEQKTLNKGLYSFSVPPVGIMYIKYI